MPLVDGERNGIIPACAGSTYPEACRAPGSWDHPRMCGEHDVSQLTTDVATGSSPHVRGAHVGGHVVLDELGIIPACAGSTLRK